MDEKDFTCDTRKYRGQVRHLKANSQTVANSQPQNNTKSTLSDGSTETKKRKSKNSGYGIHITTNFHNPICSGGGTVRSDGNNFVAEMAAATVVIKALSPNGY